METPDDEPQPDAPRDAIADSLAKADHFNDVGRHDLAERELRRALAEDPRNAPLLTELARTLDGQGLGAKARAVVREALAVDPEYAPALYRLASLLADAGQHREAEQVFLQALRAEPENPHGLTAYGFLMLKTGHLGKAEDLAHHALRLDPDLAVAHQLLSLAVGEGNRPHRALAHARTGLRLQADEEISHLAMGVACLRAGRPFAARRHLREALRIDPADRETEGLFLQADRSCRWVYLPFYWVTHLAQKLPGGVFGLWAVVVGVLTLLPLLGVPRPAVAVAGLAWILFAIYTWIAEPLVKAWTRLVPPR